MAQKNNKKLEKQVNKMSKSKEDNPSRIPALILLGIMLFSIVGFATLGNHSGASGNVNEQGIPENLAFQQINSQGQIFYAAVINYELFTFETIDGYEENMGMLDLSNQIKTLSSLDIYVDSNFTSGDTQFLIEKYAKATERGINYVQNFTSCTPNTLVLTNNNTFDSNCLVFESLNEEAYFNVQSLMYHLVK